MQRTAKALLLTGIESTYGTAIAIGSCSKVVAKSLEVQPLQADVIDRELIRGYTGSYDQILTNKTVSLTVEVELAGPGGAGQPIVVPQWDALMQACGHSSTLSDSTLVGDGDSTNDTVTYEPQNLSSLASIKALTIYYLLDNVQHKVTGCRGSFSLSCEVGAIPSITFSMQGIYHEPTAVTPPGGSEPDYAVAEAFTNANSSGFIVHGQTAAAQSFSFDQGASVVYRSLVGGPEEVLITDRRSEGSCTIEAPGGSVTAAYFAKATGEITGSTSFVHGATPRNRVKFTAARTDLGLPSYSDDNGIQMLTLPFRALPSTSGSDEYKIEVY